MTMSPAYQGKGIPVEDPLISVLGAWAMQPSILRLDVSSSATSERNARTKLRTAKIAFAEISHRAFAIA